MRRKLGCTLLVILLTAGAFTTAWWFQSPRRDLSTPAKQGVLTLRHAYVAEDELFNTSAFRPVKSIVLEFRVQTTAATIHLHEVPLRIVTSDGVTEWVEGHEVWNPPRSRGFWARIWNLITSRLHFSSTKPRTLRAYVPIAYSASARYLDVYAESFATQGSRWRLVNLPRAIHAIPPPVQTVDSYRCEDFQIHARASKHVFANSASEPPAIEVTFDTKVSHPPSPNLMMYVALKSITPEWAPDAPLLINEKEFVSQDVVIAHTARTVHLLRLPFAQHQRYMRVECESWLARHQRDMHLLHLPVQKIVTGSGKKLLVIASQRELVTDLLGGSVKVPGTAELASLPEVQSVSPSANRLFFFFRRDVRDPPGVHSLDVVAVLPEPGKAGSSFVAESVPGELERIVVDLPSGKPPPDELHMYIWGTREFWRSKKHRFTLTLPIQRDAK